MDFAEGHPFGLSLNIGGGHSGSCPAPFDAVDRHRLAGSSGTHPLHFVRLDELVRASNGPIVGGLVIDGPVRVGEQISGRLAVQAADDIRARGAILRLAGLRLVERKHSQTHTSGQTSSTEEWVQADGDLFAQEPFTDPALPATLAGGDKFETRFTVPAPPLGPPSAHLGEAIVAWALEARWDIAMHEDPFVAVAVPVLQHPDLIRAGVGDQGGLAMLDTYAAANGARIDVTSPLPAGPGSLLGVRALWPSAPDGDVRIELHRRTNAPNGQEGVVASASLPSGSLPGGAAAELAIPPDCAPSFDGAGLEVTYIVRVLVDRRLRNDAAIERPVAIA